MYAQHPLQPYRGPACAFRLWVKRFNHFAQLAPRENLVHLVEKLFPTGWLAKFLEAFISESSLSHSASPRVV